MEQLRFLSLASGSSGNCYYIGNAMRGILIDAGISVRTIRKRLKDIGIEFSNLWGIFVTHDHYDHVKAIGSLSEKQLVPVYSTRAVLNGINRNPYVRPKLAANWREIKPNEPVEVGDFRITAFPVSHDGTENFGYTIEYRGKRFTLATDLGYICENVAAHIEQANYLVIEANFDREMLMNGNYPAFLKQRIASETGHLCNEDTAQHLAHRFPPALSHLFLCHLSHHNNTPELARQTVADRLTERGIDLENAVQLVPLNRTQPTGAFVF